MPLLNGTLQLHDIQDVEKFARRILDNHLRKTRGTLNHTDTEDALAYLVETAWELSLTYNPERTSSFSKYAYTRLSLRIIDWYRTRFYRDQTNTDWYRRNNPNAKTIDPAARRQFHFPDSLDRPAETGLHNGDGDSGGFYHKEPAAPDHSGQDPLDFAQLAGTGNPLLDCDPDLFDALNRRHRTSKRHHNLRRPATTRRAA